MKILRWIGSIGALGLVLGLLLAYVSPYIDPRKFWHPAIFGLAYPYLVCASLVWLALLFLLRSKMVWLLMLVLIGGYSYFAEIYRGFGPAQGNEAESVSVLSFNTKVLGKYANNDISAKLFGTINREQPDLVCLQEVLISPAELRSFVEESNYAHYWLSSYIDKPGTKQKFGKVILSKFPVSDRGVVVMEDSNFRFGSFLDVLTPSGTVRVYNVHLQKTLVTDTDYDFLISEAGSDERTVRFSKNLLSRLIRAYRTRAGQVDVLKKELDNCPFPVLLCGDFNDTRLSFAYRQLSQAHNGLNDAFLVAGKGIAQSYLGPVPLLRLDFVMASSELHLRSFRYDKNIPSDHKMLFSRFN